MVCLVTPAVAQPSSFGRSETCGPISGDTKQDLQNVQAFCRAVPEGAAAGAYAMQSLLCAKVSRNMAHGMRADHLSAEQLVKTWMNGRRNLSGKRAVTVGAEWREVLIAEGQTTLFGRDEVTIR